MDGKLRHRPKTFMRSPIFKTAVFKLNCSNKRDVEICHPAQTLFSVQPISRVLEVQMSSFLFFFGKLTQMPRTFMKTIYSNSDVNNDSLFTQEDNGSHQVKRWPPTQ